MKSKLFLALAFATLLFSNFQCGKDPKTGALDLSFKATMNGQPLVTNEFFTYGTGKKIQFSLFHHFISDVELLKSDGTTVALSQVEYVDYSFGDAVSAAKGKTFSFVDVPVGEYTGLKIGFGVSPTLNKVKPNTLADSHPLAVNGRGEYWSSWSSYIFLKIEGSLDRDDNSILNASDYPSLVYHCGSDASYRILTFSKPIEIVANAVDLETISTEISEILKENGQPLDLDLNYRTSDDAGNLTVATILMNNLPTAVKIQ